MMLSPTDRDDRPKGFEYPPPSILGGETSQLPTTQPKKLSPTTVAKLRAIVAESRRIDSDKRR